MGVDDLFPVPGGGAMRLVGTDMAIFTSLQHCKTKMHRKRGAESAPHARRWLASIPRCPLTSNAGRSTYTHTSSSTTPGCSTKNNAGPTARARCSARPLKLSASAAARFAAFSIGPRIARQSESGSSAAGLGSFLYQLVGRELHVERIGAGRKPTFSIKTRNHQAKRRRQSPLFHISRADVRASLKRLALRLRRRSRRRPRVRC